MTYPYNEKTFVVTFDSIATVEFSEICMKEETPPIEYRTRNSIDHTTSQLNKNRKHENIMLRNGATKSKDLVAWISQLERGERRPIQIEIELTSDDKTQIIACWLLYDVIPVNYSIEEFENTAGEIALQSLELAYDAIIRKK